MVVTERSAISPICVWQENARFPSICTMQAPHSPAPQPNLVPGSLSSSRITQRRGVALGAPLDAGRPLIVNWIMSSSPHLRTRQAYSQCMRSTNAKQLRGEEQKVIMDQRCICEPTANKTIERDPG